MPSGAFVVVLKKLPGHFKLFNYPLECLWFIILPFSITGSGVREMRHILTVRAIA